MKKTVALVVLGIFISSLSGCAFKTYTFQKERVDQDVSGNRGVVMGQIPEGSAPETPPKRTVIGVDIEVPLMEDVTKVFPKGKKKEPTTDKELWGNRGYITSGKRRTEERTYPYKAERIEEISVVEEPAIIPVLKPKREVKEEYFINYKVNKGDTLSSIAAKDTIYGDSGKWRRIYEANKDILKSPSHIYPGQVLRIPMGGKEETRKSGKIK